MAEAKALKNGAPNATPCFELSSPDEAAAIGHGNPLKLLPIGLVNMSWVDTSKNALASLAE